MMRWPSARCPARVERRVERGERPDGGGCRIKRIYDQASPEDGARAGRPGLAARGHQEAAALTVAQGDRAQHRVAQMVRSRARALRRIPPPLPRRDQGQRAALERLGLPRGWPHDAALRRARSGAQQRGRACGLSARSPGGSMSVIRRESRHRARDRARRHRSLGGANAAAARVRRCA